MEISLICFANSSYTSFSSNDEFLQSIPVTFDITLILHTPTRLASLWTFFRQRRKAFGDLLGILFLE
ncbi:7098_t:CDS:2 [Diversispora eburnea]|uniref:7098_t:CDS:1 n=1 Tax=Diversispora eburnea TaxID=1213867 RepID=A0A9N8W333_9GLOM|nr:7098_t:CDS:2 [Diversispora eburnea]